MPRRIREDTLFDAKVNIANAIADFRPEGIVSSGGLVTEWRNAIRNVTATLNGTTGYLSTPDSASNRITGSFDLRWFGSMADWTPPTDDRSFIGKSGTVGDYGILFRVEVTTGKAELVLSDDGTALTNCFTTDPLGFADGSEHGMRVTWNQTTKAVVFYQRDDDDIDSEDGWTVIPSTDTANIASVHQTAGDVTVGASLSGTTDFASGTATKASMYDGISGTKVVSFNAADGDGLKGADSDSFPILTENFYDDITGVSWTGAQWTDNGDGSYTGNGSGTVSDIVFAVPNGTFSAASYQVNFTVTGMTSGNLNPTIEAAAGTDITEDGVYSQIVTVTTPTNPQAFSFDPNGDFDGTISNISVRPLWTLNGGSVIGDPFDLNVIVGTAANLREHPTGAMVLGGASDFASTPDSPANSVTGSCIFYQYVAPIDNTPSIRNVSIGKFFSTGSQFSYATSVQAGSTGLVDLRLSSSGSTIASYTSTEATGVADGVGYWLFNVFTAGTSVEHRKSLSPPTVDPATAYAASTRIGDVLTTNDASGAVTASIFDSSNDLLIGADGSGTSNNLNGNIFKAGIIDGILPQGLDFDEELISNDAVWTGYNGGVVSEDGSTLTVTEGNTDGSTPRGTTPVTTVVGAEYKFSVILEGRNVDALLAVSNNADGASGYAATTPSNTLGLVELTFTATSTTTYLVLAAASPVVGSFASWSNLSLKPTASLAVSFNAADGGDANGLDGDSFTTVFGDELVTNGDFATDTTGWTAGSNAILSVVDGRLRVTNNVTDYGYGYQEVTTVVGNQYTVVFDRSNGSNGASAVRLGTTLAGVEYYSTPSPPAADSIVTVTFTATSTSLFITLYSWGTGDGTYSEYDNVSTKLSNTFTLSGASHIQNTGSTIVTSFGGAGLETTAGQTLSANITTQMVARAHELTASNQIFYGPRADTALGVYNFIRNATPDQFAANADLDGDAGAADTDYHLWTLEYSADANTKLTVSGVGTVTGNIGVNDWDFATIFSNQLGLSSLNGSIARLIIFDKELTDPVNLNIQNELTTFHRI